MNQSFITVLKASEEDRRGLFFATANRLGVPYQNIEKDFWVCFVLDILFNYRTESSPRLLFKGGTSLSGEKAFGRQELAIDCSEHAQIFFNSAALDLKTAYVGTFSIVPSTSMIKELKRDYEAMSGMIFGEVPTFDEVIEAISVFERKLNSDVGL